MGKRIISQRRGAGSGRYVAKSFHHKGEATYPVKNLDQEAKGKVTDLIHCRGHSAPLAKISFDDNQDVLTIASEGIFIGKEIVINTKDREIGNVMKLKDIPEGSQVFNIELRPGDGGKFVRSSGGFARVLSVSDKTVSVQLPSKKVKEFSSNCRATMGIAAGGGRVDKPLLKASAAFFKSRARNKIWPKVSGSSMNAVDHPFGNSRSLRKSKAKPCKRNTPAGRKAGHVAAKRTGRKKK